MTVGFAGQCQQRFLSCDGTQVHFPLCPSHIQTLSCVSMYERRERERKRSREYFFLFAVAGKQRTRRIGIFAFPGGKSRDSSEYVPERRSFSLGCYAPVTPPDE